MLELREDGKANLVHYAQSTLSLGHHMSLDPSSLALLPTAKSPSSPSTVRYARLARSPSTHADAQLKTDDGTWDASLFPAHPLGVTSVTWAPAVGVGSLTSLEGQQQEGQQGLAQVKRFATGGCDGYVRLWGWK